MLAQYAARDLQQEAGQLYTVLPAIHPRSSKRNNCAIRYSQRKWTHAYTAMMVMIAMG